MFARIAKTYTSYPPQFWLMVTGMLISTAGASMIWPFMMIYVSKTLNSPLTVTASLLTLQSAAGLAASMSGGPLIDRIGRKRIMAFSLIANGAAYLFMGYAAGYLQFAVLMSLAGAVNPLYRSASDTMVADLVEPDRRIDAYSVMRLANNLGISIGPLVGGLLVSTSYKLGFLGAAVGMAAYGVMILLLFHETLPGLSAGAGSKPPAPRERWGGYPAILSDGTFMRFTLNFTLTTVTTVLIWTLMPVHANRNYGVPENLYAWIPFTNASMVVALQTLTTQKVKRYPVLLAMTIGSGLYALAVGGVGLAGGLGGFWVCMVVMTFGEMILAPTSSTYVANIAPVDKRGRYISLFSLYWPVASGVGPLMGGVLNDTLGPGAIWAGGFLIGALSTLAFLSFYLQQRRAVAAV